MRELANAVRSAKRVYLCGNGGSAANAIHIANDFISCGIRAHALTADIATLTAIANDYGYEHIFENQLRVFGDPEDLLIALSGSGDSQNIILALDAANSIGMMTWAITGAGGGKAPRHTENCIRVGNTMQEAENEQLVIGHSVMRELKEAR